MHLGLPLPLLSVIGAVLLSLSKSTMLPSGYNIPSCISASVVVVIELCGGALLYSLVIKMMSSIMKLCGETLWHIITMRIGSLIELHHGALSYSFVMQAL